MNWRLVPLAQARPQPWKNGGGTTRELLPLPEGGGDWWLRISVAEVERDGPFSTFPGVTRWFAVLAGAGVRLRAGEEGHALSVHSQPLQFDGAAPASCELVDGPTQDFNLMVRGGGQARMARLGPGPHEEDCAPGTLVAAYSREPLTLTLGGERCALPAHTLAWRILESGATVGLEGEGALWMEVKA